MPTSSRQLIDGLLRGNNVARVGLMEFIWFDTLRAWVKQGYPTRRMQREAGEVVRDTERGWIEVEVAGEYEEPVPPWQHFGYDMVPVGPWFDVMPIRGCNEVVEETDEWDIRRNGAGAALRYWKHKSGTPEHIDFRMVTREIWERDYRPHLLELDVERIKLLPLRRNLSAPKQAGLWVHFGSLFIWELMRQSMGDVTMYESLVLDPGWIRDYGRVYTGFYQKHFRYMVDQIGLPDGVWLYEDLGYKNGLFASPRVMESLIFPYYREMVDFFHGFDLPVVLHTCGSTAEALPLIVEAGFDALHAMERKALNNDPFVFAQEYGDRLAFVGGLDTRVFETNDKAIIRREVTDYVEGMKARGARLVFASDHSISPNTHYDSYRYALDVYREHMWY